MKIKLTFILTLIFAVLVISCSKNNAKSTESNVIEPKVYLIDESFEPGESLVYEIPHDNPNQWLKESRERRNELNRIRFEIAEELEQEYRDDRLKSRNWYLKLDRKMYKGYDVVRYHKGEFDKIVEEKHQKPVSRFALLNGFY